MNKVITDGVVLTPPPFADGLDVWSSGDGTPGSPTYAGSGGGAFVPADADFGGCLEVFSPGPLARVRYMGETPVEPGCYLRIRARIKAMGGPLPQVRIAGWAGDGSGGNLGGVDETGPEVSLPSYGEVVEVSAILGTGQRGGVDLVWPGAAYGHIGLDIVGAAGTIVRIDDLTIEDISGAYLGEMLDSVDVRDYGAIGDGVTDCAAAFEAADSAASGKRVFIPEGVFHLNGDVTFQSPVQFAGTVTMPADKKLIFQRNFDYATYLDAFGDEELAFRKAWQALLNYTDHESLDLGGRRIALSGPIDMQAAEGSKTSFAVRRIVRNGALEAADTTGWGDTVVTSQASYSASSPRTLSNVSNVANIPVGSLVTGSGVGREVYVRDRNVAARTVTLSQPLYDAEGVQVFTFTRFAYMLDFSGYANLVHIEFEGIEFQCNGRASAIMLAPVGLAFQLRACQIVKPKDRGITSIGGGCQGMMLDECQFRSNEQNLPVQQRTTLCFNSNANDVKVRNCRAVRFKHFGIMAGSGSVLVGNHWFNGDDEPNGVRVGGLVFTDYNIKSLVTGNYIDNNFIEWTNEHDATPALGQQFSFGGLTVTGNIFTANDVADWFTWIVIKPHGPGHFIHGLSVTDNVFRAINGFIDRIESIDTSIADLNRNRMRAVTFTGNVFHGVREETRNPVSLTHTEATPERVWIVDTRPHLPFSGYARTIEAVVPEERIADENDDPVYDSPWIDTVYTADPLAFRVVWRVPTAGTVRCRVRMDNPL